MPHCCDPEESNACQEAIKDVDSCDPSCTLLLFGSTVVAYSIYQTADWLLRTHKEWLNRQCQTLQSVPIAELGATPPLPREEVSTYASLKKRVQRVRHRRSQAQGVQPKLAGPERVDPLHLAKPPQRSTFSKCFKRIAQCCGFYLYSLRDEPGEEIEPHEQRGRIERGDPIREIVDEGLAGEVTIIPFEQKEAETNEEPQQPKRESATAGGARERLQKARADEKWNETVDLSATAGGAHERFQKTRADENGRKLWI